MSKQIRVCQKSDLEPTGWYCASDEYLVCVIDGEYYGYRLRCPHKKARRCKYFSVYPGMEYGQEVDRLVMCKLHEYIFNARTGNQLPRLGDDLTEPMEQVTVIEIGNEVWVQD